SGSANHGGGTSVDQNNPWFLGSDPIQYCIESPSSDYPVSLSQLKLLIKSSIEDWQRFIAKYDFSNQHWSNAPFKLPPPSSSFAEVSNCNPETEQLTFLFGKENKTTLQYGSKSEHLLGEATRGIYNYSTYRTGGTIKIKNFTSDQKKLKHLILHEIGHVLGFAHDSVFVMDERIGDRLALNEFDTYYGNIESPFWTYRISKSQDIRFFYMNNNLCSQFDKNGVTFNTAGTLPQHVRSELGLLNSDCFTLSFKITEAVVVDPLAKTVKFKSRLVLAVEGSPIKEFDSVFEAIHHDQTLDGYDNRHISMTLPQKEWPGFQRAVLIGGRDLFFEDLPATGFIGINGKIFSAAFSHKKGPALSISFPEQLKWWTLGDSLFKFASSSPN
ncbi:MAG: hypothetical protein NT027_02745, partial [Proteobacteria bacterium]|nr:hypothetical protein [Pseudomonadota bacterium]